MSIPNQKHHCYLPFDVWHSTFQVCPSEICLLSAVLGREKEEKGEGTVWHWRRNWWLWSWEKGGGWTSSRSSCQSMQNSARWAVCKIKLFWFFLKVHKTKFLSKALKCTIFMKIYWNVGTLLFPTFRTFHYSEKSIFLLVLPYYSRFVFRWLTLPMTSVFGFCSLAE